MQHITEQSYSPTNRLILTPEEFESLRAFLLPLDVELRPIVAGQEGITIQARNTFRDMAEVYTREAVPVLVEKTRRAIEEGGWRR